MAQSSFDALRHFITSRMRMSHVYQPLMLKTMLERGGSASIRQIATAFLKEDESQIEYYEQIVKNMPGRVLAKHAIVERNGDLFRSEASVATLTKPERAKLATLCQEAIAKFKAARGAAIWEHRLPGLGIIPGKQRYETLKAAGFRCELCGVSADERALDVDHILPRKHGGMWFDLHRPEQHAVNELVRQGRALTRDTDRTVAGFNVGINDGESAGQTVSHCHVHLIPRRPADVPNPRGGVRNVIPGSGDYSAS